MFCTAIHTDTGLRFNSASEVNYWERVYYVIRGENRCLIDAH
jgi:hypothetical protein